jgi:hypothetical protein
MLKDGRIIQLCTKDRYIKEGGGVDIFLFLKSGYCFFLSDYEFSDDNEIQGFSSIILSMNTDYHVFTRKSCRGFGLSKSALIALYYVFSENSFLKFLTRRPEQLTPLNKKGYNLIKSVNKFYEMNLKYKFLEEVTK